MSAEPEHDYVKLIGLKIKSFNRIEVAEMRFSGDGLVALSGRNGHGKSSALDALAWAFGGPRAVPATTSPIRHGAKSADVVVETSTFRLERRQTASGNRFAMTGKDGSDIKSSQAALDAMYSALTFDPLAFARMRPAEQRAALISALGLEDELAAIEAERKRAFDERTIAGRQLKAARVQFEALPTPDPFTPAEEVSAAELVTQIREAQALAEKRAEWDRDVDLCRMKVTMARQAMTKLRAELAELEENVPGLEADVDNSSTARDAITVPDVDALQKQLDTIEQTNRDARAAKAWRERRAELETVEREHQALDAAVEGFETARKRLIAGARLPVDGLEIHEDGLSLSGVPLGQASTAETIRLGCAVAVAQDPQLRVLRIAEGSLLDADTRAAIDEMAREHGFLILAEMVANSPSGEPGEIWIEDGATASV